ncbi:hypothetical protein [Bosea sp. TND4EK4]|uniref:hypothetical protein n=1 Tax=Bosea sp. TND4EK4 TaxID=1907408 RepID=UPI00095657DD|nr:hypothetical protein [Bosea sp. TND4EK4]SIQ73087.1 hypothetical protein SAMN05880592_10565 [Bosea sp. TND4EK4]
MHHLIVLVAAGVLCTSPALASDKPVAKSELQKLVSGNTMRVGSSSASYGADGKYSFNGGSLGRYRVDTGRICVDFDSGQARCDKIVKDAGNYYLINAQGQRYQFRP